jgi:hypothetical protein
MAAYHLLAGDGHVGKDAMTIPDYVAVAVVIVLMLWAVAGRSVDYLFGRRRSPTAAAADWEFAAVNAGADCGLMALIVPETTAYKAPVECPPGPGYCHRNCNRSVLDLDRRGPCETLAACFGYWLRQL